MKESTPTSEEPDKLMSRQEVADYLGVSYRTVEGWAEKKIGPKFTTMNGKLTRYRRSDVEAWLADQPVSQ